MDPDPKKVSFYKENYYITKKKRVKKYTKEQVFTNKYVLPMILSSLGWKLLLNNITKDLNEMNI